MQCNAINENLVKIVEMVKIVKDTVKIVSPGAGGNSKIWETSELSDSSDHIDIVGVNQSEWIII